MMLAKGNGWKVLIAFVFTSSDPYVIKHIQQVGFRSCRVIKQKEQPLSRFCRRLDLDNEVYVSTNFDNAWKLENYPYVGHSNFLTTISEDVDVTISSARTGWLVAIPVKFPTEGLDAEQTEHTVDAQFVLPVARFVGGNQNVKDILHAKHALETACADFFEFGLNLDPFDTDSRKRKALERDLNESPFFGPNGELNLPPVPPLAPVRSRGYAFPDSGNLNSSSVAATEQSDASTNLDD